MTKRETLRAAALLRLLSLVWLAAVLGAYLWSFRPIVKTILPAWPL